MLLPREQRQNKSYTLTAAMRSAVSVLPEEQVTKFAQFPHLLQAELENEIRCPDYDLAIKDLYVALREGNLEKALSIVRRIEADETRIKESLKYALLSKREKLTKREVLILSYMLDKQNASIVSICLLK